LHIKTLKRIALSPIFMRKKAILDIVSYFVTSNFCFFKHPQKIWLAV